MSDMYDLVVLGGGPGGVAAAIRAAQLGAKTANHRIPLLGRSVPESWLHPHEIAEHHAGKTGKRKAGEFERLLDRRRFFECARSSGNRKTNWSTTCPWAPKACPFERREGVRRIPAGWQDRAG